MQKKNSWVMTKVLRCRLEAAAEEFKRLKQGGKEVAIVLSGGDSVGAGVTEAERMAEYMERTLDLSRENITLEDRSTNSFFNAIRSLEKIRSLATIRNGIKNPKSKLKRMWSTVSSDSQESENLRNVIVRVVTSKFHMPRAMYIFKSCYQDHDFIRKTDCVAAMNGLNPREEALLCQDEIDKFIMPSNPKQKWTEIDEYLRSKKVKPIGNHLKGIYVQILITFLTTALEAPL